MSTSRRVVDVLPCENVPSATRIRYTLLRRSSHNVIYTALAVEWQKWVRLTDAVVAEGYAPPSFLADGNPVLFYAVSGDRWHSAYPGGDWVPCDPPTVTAWPL